MHNVNTPLLRKTLEHITAHPEEHDQRTWAERTSCGTACCVAGWAVQFAGHEIWFPEHGRAEYARDSAGVTLSIAWIAQKELGLADSEVGKLFCEDNTLADIYRFANEFTEGEIEVPDNLKPFV